jgi:hypothetical protein
MNRKFTVITALILLAASLLAACDAINNPEPTAATEPTVAVAVATLTETPLPAPTDTPTTTPTPTLAPTATATPTPLISGPVNFPANVNPLTGQVVADASLLDRNPVMIKVANFPRGLRPHSGLSWADLVFEHYMGAGATRFSAIYYGQEPPEVGPVRSARLIDAQLGVAYNTLFAFASADAQVYSRVITALGDRAISESQATCPALCRTGNGDVNSVRGYPQQLTDFAEQQRNIVPSRPNLNGLLFDPTAPESGGKSGTKVTVMYSISTISEWQYDAASGLYLRFIESVDANGVVTIVPLTDALTGDQLTAANVIILFAETLELTPTLHDFTILGNTTGRRALLFRDGQVYELIWRSQGPQQPIQFFTLAGDLMPLKPGNTWIHVVGVSSSVDELNPGEFEVFNFLP